MDSSTRYSTGLLVPSTDMTNAICALEELWISQFWPPKNFQGDLAFSNDQFRSYLKLYDITFRPVPPHRHSINIRVEAQGFT